MIKMTAQKIAFFFFIFCLMTGMSICYAQQSETRQAIQQIPFGSDNLYLSDIIRLQEQITVLNKLLQKQRVVNQMSEHYASLGAVFTPPIPPSHVCSTLPPNDLCADAYPSMYPDYIRRQAPQRRVEVPKLVTVIPDVAMSVDDIEDDSKESLKEAQFGWTDITCLSVECRAVVQPLGDEQSTSRYTVQVGTQLPNGYEITQISSKGIVVRKGQSSIGLMPVPVL